MRLLCVSVLLVLLVALACAARPQTYKIVFKEKMKPEELAQRVTIEIEDPSDGNKYTCIIPEAPPATEEASPSTTPETPADVSTVLAPLAGSFYQQEGWWTYEFVFGQYIRQFHQEKDVVLAEYYLGRGPPRSGFSTFEYYAELYGSGTACDLTQQIQYRCAPDHTIPMLNVKEIATCQYVVTVYTAHLCRHPYYKPKQDDSVPIVCIKPPHVNKYFIGQPVAFT